MSASHSLENSRLRDTNRWFHPNLSGKDAEALLKKDVIDGSFLVRHSDSKPGNFTLSVRRSKDSFIHVKIFNNGDYYDVSTGSEFASVYELISYYTEEGNLLVEKNGNNVEAKYPVYRYTADAATDLWFHGQLSNESATRLLVEHGNKNSFLIRERQRAPDELVLCVRGGDKHVTKIVIVHRKDKYYIDAEQVDNKFDSLSELVEFYKHNPIQALSGTGIILDKPLEIMVASPSHKVLNVPKLEERPQREFYIEEFEQLQKLESKNLQHSRKEGQCPENKERNRYKNILPFDHSRIVLRDGDPDVIGSDYINANLIQISNSRYPYIATQGCLASTVADFWRMVWQENSAIIAMVTKLVEAGKNKCTRYWPDKVDDALTFSIYNGRLTVKLVRREKKEDYEIREFELARSDQLAGAAESFAVAKLKTVYQYHYIAWPDKSVPKQPESLKQYIADIHDKQHALALAGPIVVHCSAGIGRTGTFIVIAVVMDRLQTGDTTINVQQLVMQVRAQRSGMVQTELQYKFIHDVVRHFCKEQKIEEAEYANLDTVQHLAPSLPNRKSVAVVSSSMNRPTQVVYENSAFEVNRTSSKKN